MKKPFITKNGYEVKYIGCYKSKYDKYPEFVYNYRGKEYRIVNNTEEKLSYLHKQEQDTIDNLLDSKPVLSTEDAMIGFNKFFDYIEGKISEEDF